MDHIIEKNKKERKGRIYFSKETENILRDLESTLEREHAELRNG